MKQANSEKAEILLESYPQLASCQGKTYLVKYGGSAMESIDVRRSVCDELAGLVGLGIRIVVVHGGGKEISRLLERLAIESHFIQGQRVTSVAAMSAIEMALSGAINKDLASRITHCGADAIGLSGRDARIFVGRTIVGPAGEDLGLAGEVVSCNTRPIYALLNSDFLPVVSPVAETVDGRALNINADFAAAALAGALNVSDCIYLTDVDGVKDGERVAAQLTETAVSAMIADGRIMGGMIPKVQCAVRALQAGCAQATICNAAKPMIVSQALTRTLQSGTAIVS
jgi:acetylglutamate kinase